MGARVGDGSSIERGELKSLREMQDRSRGYVSEERCVETTVLAHGLTRGDDRP